VKCGPSEAKERDREPPGTGKAFGFRCLEG
jgi:hypothetical protein